MIPGGQKHIHLGFFCERIRRKEQKKNTMRISFPPQLQRWKAEMVHIIKEIKEVVFSDYLSAFTMSYRPTFFIFCKVQQFLFFFLLTHRILHKSSARIVSLAKTLSFIFHQLVFSSLSALILPFCLKIIQLLPSVHLNEI